MGLKLMLRRSLSAANLLADKPLLEQSVDIGGGMTFFRSLNYAQNYSVENGSRPILILFQESEFDCYGSTILSCPIITALIPEYFTPLLIYNNSKRKDDLALMKYFSEPAWNNPVLRVVDPKNLFDIMPRLAGEYSVAAVCAYLLQALAADHISSTPK